MFNTKSFTRNIRPYVEAELAQAHEKRNQNNQPCAFTHLENAHVLGQASTRLHVKVHVQMLLWSVKTGNLREFFGQLFRIVGAATKTIFGLVPHGNTGGANVSPFKVMPIKPNLARILKKARSYEN
ncbi:DUF3703 domain-containing protein [Alteromonas sp. BL110]|uniref:DUF3703 domain-containing protein n=1 Tax=Alteromonas sp. BL110 TaxID=1714845 RepID=UPI000E52C5CE|nr:DUF3703 domain-containing protein [Alteromonas sp. BL110]AXT40144.1 DUF3703 domain-containing protein [Alteromonas sp. BL110]RKM79375.1 DUF3703 domain-containing protein [Alteromonas sp. BL110]